MSIKSLAVFCGSLSGSNVLFKQHAAELGAFIGKNNLTLIYGGGKKGLMGAVANAVLENCGEVTEIIPKPFQSRERQHLELTNLHIVEDIQARKKMMYELCDAAIILAGGNGTLDEMFDMLTWNTLRKLNKKMIILNSDGFYNHLIRHMQHMQQCDFLYENWQEKIKVANTPADVISFLDADKS